MLTSGPNQYLHPDYLQPLPTTLDAKKSPLALLAQTCSSIGKDTTPPKSIIPPLDKKDGASKDSGRKSSDNNSSRKSASPEEKSQSHRPDANHKADASPTADKSGFRAPAPKDIPPLVPISSSGDKSPSVSLTESSSVEQRDGRDSGGPGRTTPSGSSSARLSLGLETSRPDSRSPPGAPKPSVMCHPGLPSFKPELGSHLPHSLYPGCGLPMYGHPVTSLAEAVASGQSAALSAHAHSALGLSYAAKHGISPHSLTGAPGLSPYTYARVKTSAGATTLVPICRDPYCTNCQVTMQSAQMTCAAGCTQCNHEKSLSVPSSLAAASLPSSLGPLSMLNMHPGAAAASVMSQASLPSSLYSHAFGVLPGHHGLPYVCNWMAGSDYCGKRFTTSEELLQHLRTHTSSSDLPMLPSGLSYPGFGGLSAAAAASLGCHTPHYPTPGSLSPNSLRQAYPRSLSPSSLLSASRFHPYKSALSVLPPPTGLPGIPAGLGPYYSPYAFYGQRLGAAVAP